MAKFICNHCLKSIINGNNCKVINGSLYHVACIIEICDLKEEKAQRKQCSVLMDYGISEQLVGKLEDEGPVEVIQEIAEEIAKENKWLLILQSECETEYDVSSYNNMGAIKKYILTCTKDEEWYVHCLYDRGCACEVKITRGIEIDGS